MIRDIPYLASAIPAVRFHHERWDGAGYPDGLVGDEIPMMARIVSVADAFDAITTNRTYQEARSLEQAYREIVQSAGTSYDPYVISALEKAWAAGDVQRIILQ